MNRQVFHNDGPDYNWLQGRQPSPTAVQISPSSQYVFNGQCDNSQYFYEEWLSTFPYDVCWDMLEGWIGIFDPEINYSGTEIPT